jgi:hypothetical protein
VITRDCQVADLALGTWIITRMTQSGGEGSGLDKIFEYKLPKLDEEERDTYHIGAEIIAFLKWLIYTAPFKDCNAKSRGPTQVNFYKVWRGTIRAAEKRCASS